MEGESEKGAKSVMGKRKFQITNSGRISKLPKNLQTTSEDDGPPKRRTKSVISIEAEKVKLRAALQAYKEGKKTKNNGDDKKATTSNEALKIKITEQAPQKTDFAIKSTVITETPVYSIPDGGNFLCDSPALQAKEDSFSKILEFLIKIEKNEETMLQRNNEILCQMKEIKEQNMEIIKENKEMKEELKSMRVNLDKQQNRNVKKKFSETLFQPLEGFPFNTMEQFHTAELEESEKLRNDLCEYLKIRGAAKLREFLSVALKITMTDELISQFTWLDNKTTAKFGDTRISNVFFKAAKECPYFEGPRCINTYKEEMKEVFRAAKQRYRLSFTRKSATTSMIEEEEEEEDDEKLENVLEIENIFAEENLYGNLSEEEIVRKLNLLNNSAHIESENEYLVDGSEADDELE